MNTGYKIIKDFPRPDRSLVERFSQVPVPNIGDAMNRTAAIGAEIRPVNKAKLLGTAYTVRVQAGDNLLFYYALDNAKPGDVIVVDGAGYPDRALCGEIMAAMAKKHQLAGFVVDGAIRDWAEISEMTDFPVFARNTNPNGPYKNGPGEINVPVNIGGRIVYPGDILVGDGNGLVTIHPEEAEDVLEKAFAVMKKEAGMMQRIEETGSLDLGWMYEKLKQDGCEIV